MQEVKKPKKPLIYYYTIVLVVLLLVNLLLMPWVAEQRIVDTDYGTFMTMIDEKNIGQVEYNQEDNEILFTDRENTTVYRTGMVPDPDIAERLHDAGAVFSGQIIEETSPILAFLISWVLPIAIFIGLGEYMSRKIMKNVASGGVRNAIRTAKGMRRK